MLEDTCKYEMKITQENAELMYVCIYIYIYTAGIAIASLATRQSLWLQLRLEIILRDPVRFFFLSFSCFLNCLSLFFR